MPEKAHDWKINTILFTTNQFLTAYTVVHSCKPYIQPNQPWLDPSYARAIRVYLCKPYRAFKT